MDLTGRVPHERLVQVLHAVRPDELGERPQFRSVGKLFRVEWDGALGRKAHKGLLERGEADVAGADPP